MRDARAAIRALFNPASVAVVGASRETGSRSSRLISNLRRQFNGPVYPVNPHADEIGGMSAYPSVAAIPGGAQVAAVMVASTRLLPALEDCAAAGVQAAVTYASIPTDPAPLMQAIRELSERTNLRVVGPNCLGLFDVNQGSALTYTQVEAAEMGAPPGDTAIIGQSGGVLHTMWTKGAELGVRHSHFISTGNEADLTFEDFLDFLIDDTDIRTICCYVEAIRRPSLLAQVADRARRLNKTIVALKVGHSPEAQRAAFSHTGAIVGSIQHADAFLDRIGVLRVEGMSESGSVASVLRAPLPACDGVGVLTTTGGMSTGLADLCGRHGLSVPPLSPATRRVIHDLLKPSNIMNPDADNPVDLGAPAVNDRSIWLHTLDAMLADERIGVILATIGGGQVELARQSAERAVRAGKPIVFSVFSTIVGDGLARLAREGVPIYGNDSETVNAIAALIRHARQRRAPSPPAPVGPADAIAPVQGLTPLGEAAAQAWLAPHGVNFPAAESARDDRGVLDSARRIGYPVVLKVDDPHVFHKSDVGGVRVGIRDEAELRDALATMRATLATHGISDPEAFRVSQVIQHDGIEWLVGLTYDPQFGPVVAFGVGGVMAELLRDVAVEPVPLDRARARALLFKVGVADVLRAGSFRGRSIDVEALVDLLLKVSELAMHSGDRVREMDLNPVVTAPGAGALALDARVTLVE
jgi:acyl-CoA synthetase (NDP forming)